MNSGAGNHKTASHGVLVEASLANLRDHRADAARWLAVEVLLSDEAALEDADLAARLHALQAHLETVTRQRYGVA